MKKGLKIDFWKKNREIGSSDGRWFIVRTLQVEVSILTDKRTPNGTFDDAIKLTLQKLFVLKLF